MKVLKQLNKLLLISLFACNFVLIQGRHHESARRNGHKRNGHKRNGHTGTHGEPHVEHTSVEVTSDLDHSDPYNLPEIEAISVESISLEATTVETASGYGHSGPKGGSKKSIDDNYDYVEVPSDMYENEDAINAIWGSSEDYHDPEYDMDVECEEEEYSHITPKFHAKGEPEMVAPPKTGKKSTGKGSSKGYGSKSTGKGKGGCKTSKKGSKKDGMMKGKKSKSSGDMPTAPSSGDPPALPPVPVLPPTIYTPSPTNQGSVAVVLSPYALSYEVSSSSVPERKDLVPLTDLTRLYLEQFMFNEFERTTSITLDDFITKYVTANAYPMGGIAVVEFNSTARFAQGTEMFPSRAQLDEALATAFSGENLNEYIFRLRTLPLSNIFSSSPVVEFVDPPLMVSVSTPRERSGGSGLPGIIGAAVGLTILAAGALLYKRRHDEEDMDGTGFDDKGKGDMTVAGDTYAGETYDCTVSVDGSSLVDYPFHNRDEEDGRAKSYLGVIREFDASSVTPAWETESDEEDEEAEEENENGATSIDLISSPLTLTTVDSPKRSVSFSEGESRKRDYEEWMNSDRSIMSSPGQLEGLQKATTLHEFSESGSISNRTTEGRFEGTNSPSSHIMDNQGSARPSEVESLLSFDLDASQSINKADIDSKQENEGGAIPRPRTVSEIEMLLSSEVDLNLDEASEAFSDDVSTPSSRPRSVAEIEALLSQTVAPSEE